MNKLTIFIFGAVVGGAIGAISTYIFYGRKAEDRAIAFYEEQVAIFKKKENAKKIIPLEEKKPVKMTIENETNREPSDGIKFKRDKSMYTEYSKHTEACSAKEEHSERNTHDYEVLESYEQEKIEHFLKTYDSESLICYPDEHIIEHDMGEEDGDYDDFDDRDGVYNFDAVEVFGFTIADDILCTHVGNAVTGEKVDPIYVLDHYAEIIYNISYSWGPSRRLRLIGVDAGETY